MTGRAAKLGLGLFLVSAGVAMSAPASAQIVTRRWRNADTSHGTFFFGVSGGARNNGFGKHWIDPGTNVIIWPASGSDQEWQAFEEGPASEVSNLFRDFGGNTMCLAVAGNSPTQGAAMVVQECNGQVPQKWTVKKAEDYGAPFPGCFVFINANSGMVMGVSSANMVQGTQVIQWGFFQLPYHSDQFWCPQF
jgi:hypothetical protein